MNTGDIEILRLVFEHRFLRREHLSALTSRHPKRLHRRLLKLGSRRYLSTIRLPQQKFIYAIGSAGLDILVEEGIASRDVLDDRLRTHELSELFLKHQMMIVDLHVILTVASQKGPVRLVNWREGTGLYDSVVALDHEGSSRLPVRPDAFFTLQDLRREEGADRANYALEADRSTTAHARFEEKLRAYWNYIDQGLHEKKLGVKRFRVLTVTVSEARAMNLALLAASSIPERARKYFLFVALRNFEASPDPISTSLCYSARTADANSLYPLVPATKTLQNESKVV
jgi:hypothetical protein